MRTLNNTPRSASPDEAGIEIRFDYKTNLFLAALALYLLLATCFEINGSSAGMWNAVFYQNPQSHVLLGTPKNILMSGHSTLPPS